MAAHIGPRSALALGSLALGAVFFAVTMVAGVSVHVGYFMVAVALYCLAAAAVSLRRPGWGTWIWGWSPGSNLLGALAFACMGADSLLGSPRPAGYALVAVGSVALVGSVGLAWRRRPPVTQR